MLKDRYMDPHVLDGVVTIECNPWDVKKVPANLLIYLKQVCWDHLQVQRERDWQSLLI